jgi:glutamine cyclotransferase
MPVAAAIDVEWSKNCLPPPQAPAGANATDPQGIDNRRVRFYRVRVVRRVPHPGRGFTQGLIADGGTVWESTGLYGESSLRRYQLGADTPAAQRALPDELFGEGICRVGDSIWQLTWQDRFALR